MKTLESTEHISEKPVEDIARILRAVRRILQKECMLAVNQDFSSSNYFFFVFVINHRRHKDYLFTEDCSKLQFN